MHTLSRPFLAPIGALALALALLLAGAPARGASTETPGAHPSRPPGVDWFAGSVDEAFRHAQQTKKPVFLYWSAVWCPPCQELKATIFKRKDFLDRLSLFVPVYLDGDGEGAQVWGDRFHIGGYPTVVVLRGDRAEIERVSGGMDLARYAQVLDLALGDVHPKEELLQRLVAAPGHVRDPLSLRDCRLLAFDAWQQEDAWEKPETVGPLADALAAAAVRCPAGARAERARLEVIAAQAALAAEARELDAGRLPSDRLKALLAPVPAIVADRALAASIGDALEFMPRHFFAANLRLDPTHRAALARNWYALLDQLARDPRYSAADHLYAHYGLLVAAKELERDGQVPAPLAAAARHAIDTGLAREHDAHARASLVNAALNVLEVLGDEERSAQILDEEIRTSAHPYYYMSDLAEIEEKRGHTEAALRLFADSFHQAKGPATRFQWGVRYVRALVRLAPLDDAAIREAALAVLGELEASGDLHGRTRVSFGRLGASLGEWNRDGAHAASIDALRARAQSLCARFTADDAARTNCDSFLEKS